MRRFIFHPDAGIILVNAVLTVGSMGLSAYCGWLIADGQHEIIRSVSAAMFSMIALALSVYVVRRERYKISRDVHGHKRAKRAVAVLLVANLLTDYSASTALRDLTLTHTDNTNTIATNARNEVSRLQAKIKKLQTERAWLRTDLESPKAYDAKIFAQKQITERGRNIWQRSRQCTDTTLTSSQAVCTEIASLEATKQLSIRRTQLLPEISNLEAQLAAAKQSVAVNKKAGDAVSAPIIGIFHIIKRSLDNDEQEIRLGLSFFVLFMTVVFSAGIYYCSAEMGSRMGALADPVPYQPPPPQEDYWGERALPAPPNHEPIPLKSEPAPGSSTTTTTINVKGSSKADVSRLLAMIDDLEARSS